LSVSALCETPTSRLDRIQLALLRNFLFTYASPFPADMSCHANDLSGAKRSEAADQGGGDMDHGSLAVRVCCVDTGTERPRPSFDDRE